MKIREAIWSELIEARREQQEIKWIRVTRDALPRSPITCPITPERLRLHAQIIVAEPHKPSERFVTGVVYDPQTFETWRELLVHPVDWAEALRERPEPNTIAPLDMTKGPRYFGIRVIS